MPRALISWSGGKDGVWALRLARESGVEPAALVTSFDENSDCIPIHNVPMASIRRHAEKLGLPLRTVPLPWPCSNEEYVRRWSAAWRAAVRDGMDMIVFGDIHLADIRSFREKSLVGTGLTPLFPLWGRDPLQLAEEMITGGLQAVVSAVDETRLGREWIGRRFDRRFVEELPEGIDACGENGEFHTLAEL